MNLVWQVILGQHSHSQEDVLVYCAIADSVVRQLAWKSHIVDLIERQTLIFAKAITIFNLKVLIVVMMDKILADESEGDNILEFSF